MSITRTNLVQFSYAVEESLGMVNANPVQNIWNIVPFNSMDDFGVTLGRVSSNPVTKSRQMNKGTIVNLDSTLSFTTDLTLSNWRAFLPGMIFVRGSRSDVANIASNGIDSANNEYDLVSGVSAGMRNSLVVNSLLFASGAFAGGNNGLKVVDAQPAANDTHISVSDNLVDDTSNAINLSAVGYRVPAGTDATWAWNQASKTAILTLANHGFAGQGLKVGQSVHIGSYDSGDVQNAFQNAQANDMFGYARVKQINAGTVVFDKVSDELQFTDSTAPATPVDIMFSEFWANVEATDANFLEQSYQFELEYPQSGAGATTLFEYSVGNFLNTASLNLPLGEKATMNLGFVGQDTISNIQLADRRSVAGEYVKPNRLSAFNTALDIGRLRINTLDDGGTHSDFKSVTFNLNNNVTPNKVLGQLGAKYVNIGNLEVGFGAQMIFNDDSLIESIRQNRTITADFIMRNDNGALVVDIPSADMDGGNKEYPLSALVLINVNGSSHSGNDMNTSIGVSSILAPLK